MNTPTTDALSSLEAELASLRPVQPPSSLRSRIAQTLESEAPAPVSSLSEWRPLAQAAAIVLTMASLAFWLEGGGTTASAIAAAPAKDAATGVEKVVRMRPVESVQYVLSADNEGMVELPDGTFARLIRTRSVQHFEYEDPSGKSRLSCALPREDVMLVAVDAF